LNPFNARSLSRIDANRSSIKCDKDGASLDCDCDQPMIGGKLALAFIEATKRTKAPLLETPWQVEAGLTLE
jgi:hypothetical protein